MFLEFQKNIIYVGLKMVVVYFNIDLANLAVPLMLSTNPTRHSFSLSLLLQITIHLSTIVLPKFYSGYVKDILCHSMSQVVVMAFRSNEDLSTGAICNLVTEYITTKPFLIISTCLNSKPTLL